MAYQKENLTVARGSMNNYATPSGLITHTYFSDVDLQAAIAAASYFPDFLGESAEEINVDDLILARDSAKTFKSYRIDTLSPLAVTEVTVDANPFNQDLNTTDAVTFATVDTGQGANELFGMDQTVQSTSQVTFDKVTTTTGVQFPTAGGTPAILNFYEVGSFVLNLTGGFAGTVPQTVNFVRLGNIVTLRFDFVTIPQTGAAVVSSGTDVPAHLRTSMAIDMSGRMVIDNVTTMTTEASLSIAGNINLSKADGTAFGGVGNLNLQEGCLTYII